MARPLRSIAALIAAVLTGLAFGAPLTAAQMDEPRPTVDITRLRVGDMQVAHAPGHGMLWSCQTTFTGSGAFQRGPWFHSDGTFDLSRKAIVDGAVEWPSELAVEVQGSVRLITGNGLPNHPTGLYPVRTTDDAYQYDRNPNSISPQSLRVAIPAYPDVAPSPSCVRGTVGVLLTGGSLFNSVDAGGRDAVAWEAQDACGGHPERTGVYHYHAVSPCSEDPGEGHSALVGYAMDGFGIYGYRGESGAWLANEELDECHGHVHEIEWEGETVSLFHYHATFEFPYAVGCYRGSAARGPGTGGPPAGGPPALGGPPAPPAGPGFPPSPPFPPPPPRR